MDKLIANKDVMREILWHIDDRELLKICSINKRCWNVICDDNFLKRRLSKYPDIELYRENRTYKNFFLWISFVISEMKIHYNYSYTCGNISQQYDLLSSYSNKNYLLLYSAEIGEFPIVKYAVEKGADIHFSDDEALFRACYYGHLDVVKYLTTSISGFYQEIIHSICSIGKDKHFLIVKHLIETAANYNTEIDLDIILGKACESKHLETIKYLLEKGADKRHPYVVQMANMYEATHILEDL